MPERNIIVNDLFNVVLSRTSRIEPQWNEEYGEWRYKYSTARFCVITAFERPGRLVFVTAWRLKGNPA